MENKEIEMKIHRGNDPRDNFSYKEYSEDALPFLIKKGKGSTDTITDRDNNIRMNVRKGKDPRDNFSYKEYSKETSPFYIRKGDDPADNFSHGTDIENTVCFNIIVESNHC